jgi:hypothetical protein
MKMKRWKRSVRLKNGLVGCLALAGITMMSKSQTLQIESIPSPTGEGQTIISRNFDDGTGVPGLDFMDRHQPTCRLEETSGQLDHAKPDRKSIHGAQ